ncbi:MAG: hypothetical protein HGN29_16525 [Asgard group archaeon]|nr:hypothetical protein [Asgard group archaeon]
MNQKFSHRLDRKSLYCSKRCMRMGIRKHMLAYSIFVFLTLFSTGVIFYFDDYLSYFFYILMAAGFLTALPFAIMSLRGFINFKEEKQRKLFEKNYCIYCGEELERPSDAGPLVCMRCGKKTPICGICNGRIEKEEEVFKATPCGHIFHRRELLDWLESNNICPVCKEKISEVDINFKK